MLPENDWKTYLIGFAISHNTRQIVLVFGAGKIALKAEFLYFVITKIGVSSSSTKWFFYSTYQCIMIHARKIITPFCSFFPSIPVRISHVKWHLCYLQFCEFYICKIVVSVPEGARGRRRWPKGLLINRTREIKLFSLGLFWNALDLMSKQKKMLEWITMNICILSWALKNHCTKMRIAMKPSCLYDTILKNCFVIHA